MRTAASNRGLRCLLAFVFVEARKHKAVRYGTFKKYTTAPTSGEETVKVRCGAVACAR